MQLETTLWRKIMTADNKLLALILKVVEKTLQGKIDWKKGALLNSFSYSIMNTSVAVSISNINNVDYAYFSVMDENGLVIEYAGESFVWDPDKNQNPISYLYSIAKRRALKIDETIGNISSYLDRL